MKIKIRRENFGYIIFDGEHDKFWRLSKEDYKKFKIPKIDDYSSPKAYGSKDLNVKDLSAPISIGWMLTNECNSKCLHCRANSGERERNELNFNQIKRILRMLDSMKVMRVVFSGGEPLMRGDIDKILDYATSKTNLSIVLGTNSLLLDNHLDYVKKVNFIETSIESINPSKHDYFRNCEGSFLRVIQNIRLLKKKVPLRIFTTLSKLNIQDVEEISSLCYDLGAREHEFIRYIPTGRGKTNAPEFALSDKEYRETMDKIKKIATKYRGKMAIECVDIKKNNKFNQSYVLIRPNGDMYTYSTYSDDIILIGSLLKENLKELWNGGIINKKGHLMLWTAESFF